MQLDQISHLIKINYKEEEIISDFSSPGLVAEWNLSLDFLLENFDDSLEITVSR